MNHHYNSNPNLRRRMVRELGLGFNAPFSSDDGPWRQPSFPRPLSAADSLEQSSDQHFTALEREPRRRWRGAPFGVRGSSALRSGSLKRQRQTALQVTATKAAGQRSCPDLHAYLPECGGILSSWHSHLARLFEKEVLVRLDQRRGPLDSSSLN